MGPLAGRLAARPSTAPALDGRPSVIPWLRRLSSPTAIKFRRSLGGIGPRPKRPRRFLHGQVVGHSALGVCVSQEEKGKKGSKERKIRSGCSVAAGAWHVSPLNPSANHRLACLRFRGFHHLLLIILFWISFFPTLLLPSYHLYCYLLFSEPWVVFLAAVAILRSCSPEPCLRLIPSTL